VQGQSEYPLTDLGREQARRAAGRVAELGSVSALYSSDLSRAMETGEIIAERLRVNLIPLADAREYGFGALEGLTREEFAARFPELVPAYPNFYQAPAPGREDPAGFRRRVEGVLARLLSWHPGERVALVSHGRFMNMALGVILKTESAFWRFNNGSVTLIETLKHGPLVHFLNDTRHLGGLEE
jgi:broad specificity phosphatase PhoE